MIPRDRIEELLALEQRCKEREDDWHRARDAVAAAKREYETATDDLIRMTRDVLHECADGLGINLEEPDDARAV